MQRCLDMVQIPIMVEDGHAAMVGCSIGIAYYEGENESCDSLLERADEAMYMAKNAGKGRIIESAWNKAREHIRSSGSYCLAYENEEPKRS
jgi:diguanylate cyclase (GGDEF)-like protein